MKSLISLGNAVAICDRWIPATTLKIKMVAKISAFTGRAIPVVGWIILASDVSQIAYRTVRDYNRIARGSDKIW